MIWLTVLVFPRIAKSVVEGRSFRITLDAFVLGVFR